MPIAKSVFDQFEDQMPSDPNEQCRVIELGLKELRIQKALEAYRRGIGSLAFAARQAGIPLRQMIPTAFAHGVEPRLESHLVDTEELTAEEASAL